MLRASRADRGCAPGARRAHVYQNYILYKYVMCIVGLCCLLCSTYVVFCVIETIMGELTKDLSRNEWDIDLWFYWNKVLLNSFMNVLYKYYGGLVFLNEF